MINLILVVGSVNSKSDTITPVPLVPYINIGGAQVVKTGDSTTGGYPMASEFNGKVYIQGKLVCVEGDKGFTPSKLNSKVFIHF